MKISELRKIGYTIGRQGMSDLVLDAVNACDMSPKGLMELCGALSVISKMATCDSYWGEQVSRGEQKMEFKVEQIGKN